MTDYSAFECSLCSSDQIERREALLSEISAAAVRRGEVEGGVFLEFPGDDTNADLVARFVGFERQCCQFVLFSVTYSPDFGPIRVEMTAPPGAQEFLKAVAGL